MIIGHGIDLQEISRIQEAIEKNPHFVEKVLTATEYSHFQNLSDRRGVEYLAGRWAAKEAFSKALGTGIGKIGFQDIEILTEEKGAPYVHRSPIAAKAWVSISHSGNFVQASVILEEMNES